MWSPETIGSVATGSQRKNLTAVCVRGEKKDIGEPSL